ncbi:universal stress protein [Listeria ilorinensis]|uniref:universal stress protein n=1 Tax=Listeria ilorinensis TaxID=2867439 RepID=UPI001EF4E888|nr:universal stress protein [Listeria ilorinensis]
MGEYRKILLALDKSEKTAAVLKKGLYIARREEAEEVVLASIVDPGVYAAAMAYDEGILERRLQETADWLNDIAEQARAEGVANVRTIVREGVPKKCLVHDVLPEVNPDLIICGDRQLNEFEYLLTLGSVSSYIIHHSKCDVTVVKD